MPFTGQKLFLLVWSKWVSLWMLFSKFCLTPGSPLHFPLSFLVLSFTFKFLIYLESTFVWKYDRGPILFYLSIFPILSINTISFPRWFGMPPLLYVSIKLSGLFVGSCALTALLLTPWHLVGWVSFLVLKSFPNRMNVRIDLSFSNILLEFLLELHLRMKSKNKYLTTLRS